MPAPSIQDFNFGYVVENEVGADGREIRNTSIVVPLSEPTSTHYRDFTIYHVARALSNFNLAGGNRVTVPSILKEFPVSSHISPPPHLFPHGAG